MNQRPTARPGHHRRRGRFGPGPPTRLPHEGGFEDGRIVPTRRRIPIHGGVSPMRAVGLAVLALLFIILMALEVVASRLPPSPPLP
jgi:hypothetical protein